MLPQIRVFYEAYVDALADGDDIPQILSWVSDSFQEKKGREETLFFWWQDRASIAEELMSWTDECFGRGFLNPDVTDVLVAFSEPHPLERAIRRLQSMKPM